MDTLEILALLRETADVVINPRFQALNDDQVTTKAGPNDLVTVADREAEQYLVARLQAAFPQALVFGEETVYTDPGVLSRLSGAEHALIIDPIDGTRNFVNGDPRYGVMLAETKNGVTTRGWIWQPQWQQSFVVERGAGVRRNNEPVVRPTIDRPPLGGASNRRLHGFDADGALSPVVGSNFSVAFDYPAIMSGELDFMFYTTMHPWDHLAGILMLEELGGVAKLRDGSRYAMESDLAGMIVADSEATCDLAWQHWPGLG